MGIREAKAPALLRLRPVRQLARRAFALLAQEEGLDGIGEAARAAAEEAVGALGDVVAGGVGVAVVVLFAHCCVWWGREGKGRWGLLLLEGWIDVFGREENGMVWGVVGGVDVLLEGWIEMGRVGS
jgi:hypothetical protein